MTIDEAIAKAEYVADCRERCAEHTATKKAKESISESAAESRQLAKWLTELKDLRERYSAQTEVIRFFESDNKQLDERLKEAKRLLKQVCCDFSNDKAVRLDHLNEALQFLKLIGETNDEP